MLDTILRYSCDLSRGISFTPIRPALLTMDSQAHTIQVACMRGGAAESLTGYAVNGYFIRADGITVPITGSADGNVAAVTLTGPCYAVPGRFQLVVKVSAGDAVSAVFYGDGSVSVSQTDALVDEEHIVPSLEELLRKIEEMEHLAQEAGKVVGMTAQATTLAPGSAATASYADGVLKLGIPRGDVGAPGSGAPYNSLDNSYFRNPVNQRGATSYSGAVYGVDRWMMGHSAMAMQVNSGYITLTNSDSTWRSCMQRFTKGIITIGKTYTAALAFTDGTILSGNAVIQDGVETRVDDMSMSGVGIFINCVNTGYDYLNISMAGGSSRNLVWAALYEGAYTADTLPAYQPKGYAAELAECKRYCTILPEQTSCLFSTSEQSGKYFAASINFDHMRIIPTVVFDKDSDGKIGVVQGVGFVDESEFDFAYIKNGALLPSTTNAAYAGKVMSFYGIGLTADL